MEDGAQSNTIPKIEGLCRYSTVCETRWKLLNLELRRLVLID